MLNRVHCRITMTHLNYFYPVYLTNENNLNDKCKHNI